MRRGRVLGQIEWLETQQVGFHSEGIHSKSRAIAHVGDAFKVDRVCTGAHPQVGHVHAVRGQQVVIRCQVHGRHGVFRAIAATSGRCAVDGERAAQQVAGMPKLPCGNQRANAARRHDLTPTVQRRKDGGGEAKLLAKFCKALHVRFTTVAQPKVCALVNLQCMQGVSQNLSTEISRAGLCKLLREGQQ